MKNTVYLYVRMLVTMALSFITTRVVLEKLGASDYGVQNVVGGFVSMFVVLDSILASGTNRFFALSLGKGEIEKIKKTFSTSFVIHLSISLLVFIVLETLGIWFLNHKLNIEPDRIHAANWVFQFAVITTVLGITQTPYRAAVTAHEHFNMYAYMSIYDAVAKLIILYLLVTIPGDKLIIYSALLLGVNTSSLIIYRIYCIRKFEECGLSLRVDKLLLREMLHFSGWTTLGHLTVAVNDQGMSILLNLFFNTVMNAARGLANTVSFTIKQFIGGFLIAANPQLVKYYGEGDKINFEKLIFNISQYTIFLMSIFLVPVLLEIDYVLKLWLSEVPQYTAEFIKISAICDIIVYSNSMVDSGIVATGRVKEMNIYAIPFYFMTLPLVYIVLKLGWYPPVVYFVTSIPALIHFLINLKILSHYTGFPARKYFVKIFLKNTFLIILTFIIPFLIHRIIEESLIRFLVVCSSSVISTITIMYFFALNPEVKKIVTNKVFTILHIKK
ncbi:lipopolysaccharide biosynthesis protein [Plebeiibacterium sediminum]|uniref:MATE family efflux transporter n=1 Tax=Plebeiibacterium sediminum TaxID=2992112 RepID=A0AAE3M4F7_9BACT|nr:MATE family efflux transporter [Plebeiobacterium sediminum]MCW3786657.1 MATE family efflux transporter [Plebeiobacterium sediminum]